MEYPAGFARDKEIGGFVVGFPDVPASPPKRGRRMIRVPALSEAKFKLYSALHAEGMKKIDLARRLQCSPKPKFLG